MLMNRLIALIVFSTLPAGAANLLHNPGFETRVGDLPAEWHVYVEPQDGSTAELYGADALEGRWSVMLHNAQPYAKEPANNWSQNILEDLAGKTLVVTGNIKTEDAASAAVWIQCFRKDPWEVLLQKSTADAQPINGANPWTPVEMQVKVPDDTDFVVLRCVLMGTGTAWFDALSVDKKESATVSAPAAEKPVVAPVTPTMPAVPKLPVAPQTSPPPSDAARNEIISAQQAIQQANEALRESNRALAEQLQAMRDQLESMRKQLHDVSAATKEEDDTATKGSKPAVPPLIPHGATAVERDTP